MKIQILLIVVILIISIILFLFFYNIYKNIKLQPIININEDTTITHWSQHVPKDAHPLKIAICISGDPKYIDGQHYNKFKNNLLNKYDCDIFCHYWKPNNIINKTSSNSIIFVTAFKDIGRGKWKNNRRTIDTYINYFTILAYNIEYTLLVFVSTDIMNILKRYNFSKNIIFIDTYNIITFFEQYLESEKKLITCDEYKEKVPEHRRNYPEHSIAEYNLINHSKINYIAHAKKLYPNFNFYAWIDFAVRDINDIPKNIDITVLTNKISVLVLKMPYNRIEESDILKTDDIYIAGSQYVIHTDIVELYEHLYKEKLDKWKTEIICDDDQSLMLQIYYDNKDLFSLYYSDEWFSLFRKFLNIYDIGQAGPDIHNKIEKLYNPTLLSVSPIMGKNIDTTKYALSNITKISNNICYKYISMEVSYKLLIKHAAMTGIKYDFIINHQFDNLIIDFPNMYHLDQDHIYYSNINPINGYIADSEYIVPYKYAKQTMCIINNIDKIYNEGFYLNNENICWYNLWYEKLLKNTIKLPLDIYNCQ